MHCVLYKMVEERGEELHAQEDVKAEVKKDTSHAPDLLEGPSVNRSSKYIHVYPAYYCQ